MHPDFPLARREDDAGEVLVQTGEVDKYLALLLNRASTLNRSHQLCFFPLGRMPRDCVYVG